MKAAEAVTGRGAEIVDAASRWLAEVQSNGVRVAVVEGLPGAGKTSLARAVGAACGWAVVELDDFAERIDRPDLPWVDLVQRGGALDGIAASVAAGPTLIEGAAAWPVVELWAQERAYTALIARGYVKRVSEVGGVVFWDDLDGLREHIRNVGLSMGSIYAYHLDARPWKIAEAVFERVDED